MANFFYANIDFFVIILITILSLYCGIDTIYRDRKMDNSESKIRIGFSIFLCVFALIHLILLATTMSSSIAVEVRVFLLILFYTCSVILFPWLIYENRDFNNIELDKQITLVSSAVCLFLIVIYPGYFPLYIGFINHKLM